MAIVEAIKRSPPRPGPEEAAEAAAARGEDPHRSLPGLVEYIHGGDGGCGR